MMRFGTHLHARASAHLPASQRHCVWRWLLRVVLHILRGNHLSNTTCLTHCVFGYGIRDHRLEVLHVEIMITDRVQTKKLQNNQNEENTVNKQEIKQKRADRYLKYDGPGT